MIACRCGEKISYFLWIAYPENSSITRNNRPIGVSGDGSLLLCDNCFQQDSTNWLKHNRGRVEPYLVKSAKVNIDANTKSEFEKKARTQIWAQFKVQNIWIPKSDIKSAVNKTSKTQKKLPYQPPLFRKSKV